MPSLLLNRGQWTARRTIRGFCLLQEDHNKFHLIIYYYIKATKRRLEWVQEARDRARERPKEPRTTAQMPIIVLVRRRRRLDFYRKNDLIIGPESAEKTRTSPLNTDRPVEQIRRQFSNGFLRRGNEESLEATRRYRTKWTSERGGGKVATVERRLSTTRN